MNNRRNYYRVLQVQPDAAADVVKASYRTLMQKLRLHPDLGGDEGHAALRYARAVPLGAAGNGLLEDLSSHGLRFVTDRELAVRERLRIECELLGAVARVVSCRMRREPPGSHAVGVAFITVDFHRSRGSLLAVQA